MAEGLGSALRLRLERGSLTAQRRLLGVEVTRSVLAGGMGCGRRVALPEEVHVLIPGA